MYFSWQLFATLLYYNLYVDIYSNDFLCFHRFKMYFATVSTWQTFDAFWCRENKCDKSAYLVLFTFHLSHPSTCCQQTLSKLGLVRILYSWDYFNATKFIYSNTHAHFDSDKASLFITQIAITCALILRLTVTRMVTRHSKSLWSSLS